MGLHRLLQSEGREVDIVEEGMDHMVARNEALQNKEREELDLDVQEQAAEQGLPRPQTRSNIVDTRVAEATARSEESNSKDGIESKEAKLFSMGAATACAVALHNFPEGLITFVTYVDDPGVGVALAVAIAIHNIPEGLCVAMPIYYATGSRWKGFLWGTFSGVSEPLGALVGWLIVGHSFSGNTNGILFGLVAGVMVYLCIDELFPMAYKYDPKGDVVTWSCVFGMFLISLSLLLFNSS
jgi:zinc transporter ZupT